MTNIPRAQVAGEPLVDSWKWGNPTTGYPTRRPDGRVVKVPILDPNDPGMADRDGMKRTKDRAKAGSAALLEAMKKLQAAA